MPNSANLSPKEVISWMQEELPKLSKIDVPSLSLRFQEPIPLKAGPMLCCADIVTYPDRLREMATSLIVNARRNKLTISKVEGAPDEFEWEGERVTNFRRNKYFIVFEPITEG